MRIYFFIAALAGCGSSPHATDAGDVIDGVCGSANGVAVSVAPTTNLCSSGTPTEVRGSGPWVWLCEGGVGGNGADCGAPYTFPAGFADPECLPAAGTVDARDLPGPSTLPTDVSFVSDWTQRPIAGGFDAKDAIDVCRLHPDGFKTWHGKPAVRIEVDPGDDPAANGHERAEVMTMQGTTSANLAAESATGGVVYYATSYYFPTNWDGTALTGDATSWSFVGQFHYWGGITAGRRSAGGPQIYSFRRIYNTDELTFSDDHIALGKWTDFVLRVDWSNLLFTIYRRDEGETTFRMVAGASDANMNGASYYEEGLDRGHVAGRTDVLWIGPTSRGGTFAAVEQASFGTNNGL